RPAVALSYFFFFGLFAAFADFAFGAGLLASLRGAGVGFFGLAAALTGPAGCCSAFFFSRAGLRAAAAASFFSRARRAASFSAWARRSASSGSVTIDACGRRFLTASSRSSGTRSRKKLASRVSLALAR